MSDDETTDMMIDERYDDWRDEDESELLPRRRPQAGFTRVTGGLLALLLLACGFIGGVLVQTQAGGNGGAQGGLAARPAGGGRAGGGAGGGGAGGGGRAAGSARGGGTTGFAAGSGGANVTFGTVSSVDGGTLYVTDPNGNTLKVTAAKSATVRRTIASRVSAINPGETVVVQGPAKHGAITATSISATPAPSGGVGGGGSALSQLFSAGGGGGGGARGPGGKVPGDATFSKGGG